MSKINESKITGTLVYIPIEELYPHPDNPRKKLGDLTELAESIKVKGVLQNLTVVKGHAQTKREFSKYSKIYKENPTEANRETLNSKQYGDGYTIIIGHRRMAAAKLAGLTHLPCIIANMTPEEQVTTMLLENMQRSELTVYEQAKGFQLMLDLGNTVETIAEKSGFSQTTVRRRVKLLDLDEQKFKKSESRGVTLYEYMELDKIKDVDLKNQVLDYIGTANFKNELRKAIEFEETKEYFDAVEAQVSKFAVKIDSNIGYIYVDSYSTWNKKEVIAPKDSEEVQYYYSRDDYRIAIYKLKEEGDVDVDVDVDEEAERLKAEKSADKERRLAGLREVSARAFELRRDAINCISNSHAQRHLSEILAFIFKIARVYYCELDYDDVVEVLGVDVNSKEFEGWDDEELDTYISNEIDACSRECPAKMLLKCAYILSRDSEFTTYYSTCNATRVENEQLNIIYDFLHSLGYKMSDEEKALRAGTHELFLK